MGDIHNPLIVVRDRILDRLGRRKRKSRRPIDQLKECSIRIKREAYIDRLGKKQDISPDSQSSCIQIIGDLLPIEIHLSKNVNDILLNYDSETETVDPNYIIKVEPSSVPVSPIHLSKTQVSSSVPQSQWSLPKLNCPAFTPKTHNWSPSKPPQSPTSTSTTLESNAPPTPSEIVFVPKTFNMSQISQSFPTTVTSTESSCKIATVLQTQITKFNTIDCDKIQTEASTQEDSGDEEVQIITEFVNTKKMPLNENFVYSNFNGSGHSANVNPLSTPINLEKVAHSTDIHENVSCVIGVESLSNNLKEFLSDDDDINVNFVFIEKHSVIKRCDILKPIKVYSSIFNFKPRDSKRMCYNLTKMFR